MWCPLPSGPSARVALAAATVVVASCARPSAGRVAERELHVVGNDYAFAAPDSIDAGVVHVSFENRGRVRHEMLFSRIAPDVPTKQFTDSLFSGASVRALRDQGSAVLFANPGQRNDGVRLRMTFAKGERWAIWCQFRDSAGKPKHQVLGMAKLLVVR